MIKVTADTSSFMKEVNNVLQYSIGFFEGVNKAEPVLLNNLGKAAIEMLKEFIDSNARVNPEALHHMYEWHETGSPSARLFDIDYVVSGTGISFSSSFRQSTSVKNGSTTAFYDKARIMEQGLPVTIVPKAAEVLVFEKDGETVFTRGPVTVTEPGGAAVNRSYEKTLDLFFQNYFSQAFLKSSGIIDYLKNPTAYRTNLQAGKRSGKSKGIEVGYNWMANTGVDF